MLAFEFTIDYVCPQVVVSNKCNIAQLHFDINKEIPLKQSSRSNFCHSFMKVLLFLYVCPQFVLLGKSKNALFTFRFIFDFIGGYTFEVVKEEQYADHSSMEVMLFLYVCPKVVLLLKGLVIEFALEARYLDNLSASCINNHVDLIQSVLSLQVVCSKVCYAALD